MKKIKKTIINLIVLMLLIVLTVGCEVANTDDILNNGGSKFGSGKPSKDYNIEDSAQLLEHMINHYSGSRSVPKSIEFNDNDLDNGGVVPDDENFDTYVAGKDTIKGTAGSYEELMDLMHKVFQATANKLVIKFVNGYELDLTQSFEAMYELLRSKDPVGVCCLSTYSLRQSKYSNVVTIVLDYTPRVNEVINLKNDTISLLQNAKKDINVSGMSEYEKVDAVNTYLCDKVKYADVTPYAPETHMAYGALRDGVAVCDGYSCAATLLLREYGVECELIVGTCIDGGGHAWNMVCLDGEWYHMDITWNDGCGKRDKYLLVTDEFMSESRTWDSSLYHSTPSHAYSPS